MSSGRSGWRKETLEMTKEHKVERGRCGLLRLRVGWLHYSSRPFKKNDEGTKKDMFPTVPDKERCHFLSGQRTGTYGPSAHSQEWVLDCWAPTNAVQVWFQGRSCEPWLYPPPSGVSRCRNSSKARGHKM